MDKPKNGSPSPTRVSKSDKQKNGSPSPTRVSKSDKHKNSSPSPTRTSKSDKNKNAAPPSPIPLSKSEKKEPLSLEELLTKKKAEELARSKVCGVFLCIHTTYVGSLL